MSYQFPKRVLRTGDVLDPREFTIELSTAANRISGRLNAHNFEDSVSSSIQVDPYAFTRPYPATVKVPFGDDHVATIAEPWTGSPDTIFPASGTVNEDAFLVQNTFEWQVITDNNGSALRVDPVTGTSVLLIEAFAQVLWYGFWEQLEPRSYIVFDGASHFNNADERPINIHFALRVNGNIIQESLTGINDVTYRASLPFKPMEQRNADDALMFPGPRDIPGEPISGLGPAALPVRVSAQVPVPAGTQTVELVVRRVPLIKNTGSTSTTAFDFVHVYCRQLVVTDLKSFPVGAAAAADVDVSAFESEDLISQSSMYTQRVEPLIVAHNNVQEGNLMRGALMHAHLPQTLLSAMFEHVVFNDPVYVNCIYPGFTSSTISPAIYTGSPDRIGWSLLTDGAGNDLLLSNVPIGDPTSILILANVEVERIDPKCDLVSRQSPRKVDDSLVSSEIGATSFGVYSGGFAVFRLMYRFNGGSWVSLTESTGMVNAFGDFNKAYEVDFDVPLMALLAPGISVGVVDIGVFGAVMNIDHPDLNPSPQETEFSCTRGSINVIGMRR